MRVFGFDDGIGASRHAAIIAGDRHRIGRVVGCVAAAVCMILAGAGYAQALTFGTDLNAATADNPYACSLAGGASGCTVHDPIRTDMELVLPDPVANGNQTGVVTAIHVKSAATAPAQFVAVEWSGRPGDAQPFPSGVSAVSEQVTLQPGMNHFSTNLPVSRRFLSNGFATWSVVSLNILNATSPIPAQLGGSFSTMGVLLDNYLPLTQTVADLTIPPHNVAVGGFPPATLLMSGDVTLTTPAPTPTPTPTPTTTPTPTPIAPQVPQLAAPATGRIKNGAARLRLQCLGTADCAGLLRIQNRPTGGAATADRRKKKPKRPTTYATTTFSIAAGQSQTVKARLSKAGKRYFKKRRKAALWANVTLGTETTGSVKSSKISLGFK